jgi:hypothetical protein
VIILAALVLYEGVFGPADFATKLFDYSGINGVPGYNVDATQVLGYPAPDATPSVPDNSSLFSFGWGGYVTVGFDRPIRNYPGPDFIIFGNAFYPGGVEQEVWREPGYVEVGVDLDKNGEPSAGDAWFLLRGSPAPPFPLPPEFWGVYEGQTVAYADCTPTDNTGNPLIADDPLTVGIDRGSAGGDAMDLEWAVDWATGLPVRLTEAHFVRIWHALDTGSFLGPSSTEVDAVALIPRPLFVNVVDFEKRR